MSGSLVETNFEIEQYNYTVYVSGGVYLVLSLFFLWNFCHCKIRIHCILTISCFLSFLSSFLYLFSRPFISISNAWLYILEGQLEKVAEIGAFAVYLVFVISRLALVKQGIQKWQTTLSTLTILFLLAHLIRQAFQDIYVVTGIPPFSDDIRTALLIVSMVYFFGTNFSLNFYLYKWVAAKYFLNQQERDSVYKCKKLVLFLYGSIVTTALGIILMNIDWDPNDLPLFHSMNTFGTLGIAGHFYFEWLFQVLLVDILKPQSAIPSATVTSSKKSNGNSVLEP